MDGWAIGKPFGKHKLIPSVSPGKSWEGAIAGLLASMIAATVLVVIGGVRNGIEDSRSADSDVFREDRFAIL